MILKEYIAPETIEEADALLHSGRGGVILAGVTYLNRQQELEIPLGIDLCKLGLDTIEKQGDQLVIGAMASYRAVEQSPLCTGAFSVLSEAVRPIMGVQLRRHITVGGGVAKATGYCDLTTPLLALDATLSFYRAGDVKLEEHLMHPVQDDILLKITVPPAEFSAYSAVRHSQNDHCYLNAAVANTKNAGLRIAVGGQPAGVACAQKAQEILKEGITPKTIAAAAEAAQAELVFEKDLRASAEYRRQICAPLIQRVLEAIK